MHRENISALYVSPQKLIWSCRKETQLTTEIEQLRREKAELVGKVESQKLMVRFIPVKFK